MYKLCLILLFMQFSLIASHEATPDEIRRYTREMKQDAANFVEISRVFNNSAVSVRADRLLQRLKEFFEHITNNEPYQWSSRQKFGLVSIEYSNIEYFFQHNEVEDSIRDVFNRMATAYWELSGYYNNPFFPSKQSFD